MTDMKHTKSSVLSGTASRILDNSRIARVYSKAMRADLSEETRRYLEKELLAKFNIGGAPVNSVVEPPVVATPSVTNKPETSMARGVDRGRELELKIRHLVSSNADWDAIAKVALQYFDEIPTVATAVKLFELAAVKANVNQLNSLFKQLASTGLDFYLDIHASVREVVVASLWENNQTNMLVRYVVKHMESQELIAIEKLFVFDTLRKSRDQVSAFFYFKNNRKELEDIANRVGAKVDLGLNQLRLAVGMIALKEGQKNEAKKILERIPHSDPCYETALEAILQLYDKDANLKLDTSEYVQELLRTSHWKKRTALIESYITRTRKLGGIRDFNRPIVNDLLTDLLKWIPKEEKPLAELGRIIFDNRDTVKLLPNLFKVFDDYSVKYLAPNLDKSLWSAWLNGFVPGSPSEQYYVGIANLHYFVATGCGDEKPLWDARNWIANAHMDTKNPLPFKWQDLHQGAKAYVSKSVRIYEEDKREAFIKLNIAADIKNVSASDVSDYLDNMHNAPSYVYKALQIIARHNEEKDLEVKILLKGADVTSLTNADLKSIYNSSCQSRNYDRAWISATVLNSRKVLPAKFVHPWSISGEKRTEYPLILPSTDTLNLCYSGLATENIRLIKNLMKIGSAIPALIDVIEDGKQVKYKQKYPKDTFEFKLENRLNELWWLSGSQNVKLFRKDQVQCVFGDLPAFIKGMPKTRWAYLYVRLGEKLGLNSWGWQASKLQRYIDAILPGLSRKQNVLQNSARIGRWIRCLSGEQRMSWQELVNSVGKIDDEAFMADMAKFLVRLTVLMMPAHTHALDSLRAMRVPAELIWDLEKWLLSDTYLEFRKKMKLGIKIPIPTAISYIV